MLSAAFLWRRRDSVGHRVPHFSGQQPPLTAPLGRTVSPQCGVPHHLPAE
jgi:hypothetical protein